MDASEPIRVNPNTADREALTSLPGVGPTIADRIIAARPFEGADDLTGVAGIGTGLLERIQPLLTFQAEESGEGEGEDQPLEHPSLRRAPVPEEAVKGISRGGAAGLAFGMGLASLILSVLFTLLILLAINGTLDIANHEALRAARGDLTQLELSLESQSRDLDRMDRQLDALEGISGRMTEVESELEALSEAVNESQTQVSTMQRTVEALDADFDRLSGIVERFQAFLQGLDQLMDELNLDLGEAPGTPSPTLQGGSDG